MSTKLTVAVVATLPRPNQSEVVASRITQNTFSPNVLDAHLPELLVRAAATLRDEGFADPKACKLEISVQLSSDEAGLRPALHLSKAVIDQLAAVGASVDFDPYCSP